ncbi:MAG: type IV pilin protein [Pseudomonadota bacterium]
MNTQRGFSLIEILIAVIIIGILAGIAYPVYTDQVLRAGRTDGQKALLTVMQAEERYYNNSGNYSYTTNLAGTPTTGLQLNVDGGAYISDDERYRVTAGQCDGQPLEECVELTATAIGAQAEDNDCATLIYRSTGVKDSTGGGDDCW